MRRLFDRTLKPLCVSARSVTIRWLERRNGIHTEVEIELEDLGVDAPGRVRSQASRLVHHASHPASEKGGIR